MPCFSRVGWTFRILNWTYNWLRAPNAILQVPPGFHLQGEHDDLFRFALDTIYRKVGDQQVSTIKRRVEDAAGSIASSSVWYDLHRNQA